MILCRKFALRSLYWILLLGIVLLVAGMKVGVPIELHIDPAQVVQEQGNCYLVRLPELRWPLVVAADGRDAPEASDSELLENGRLLGPAHANHNSIRRFGKGYFSHWQGKLYFSTSDNSNPRTNGKRYIAVVRGRLVPQVILVWFLFLGVITVAVLVWWFHQGLVGLADLLLPAGLWSGTVLLFDMATRAEGIGLWFLLGGAIVCLIWSLAVTRHTLARGTGRSVTGYKGAQNTTLLMASVILSLVAAEALLTVWERRITRPEPLSSPAAVRQEEQGSTELESAALPIERTLKSFGVKLPRELIVAAARRSALITQPAEFDQQPMTVEGAVQAFKWQGVVHAKDENGMRRVIPLPARREHVFRVMVVGDSLTYGFGIDERWTYPRQLEILLGSDYQVEVLNLGVSGYQSQDIYHKVQEFLPRLRPHLVVYGVCINDFLPAGRGQYVNNYAYTVPLPESVKTFFHDRSRFARLSEDAYNRGLLKVGLRVDFIGDILNGFTELQDRFARDVAHMNEFVTARGLPPVVTLVLDQRPVVGSRDHRITTVAEELLKNARMDVVHMGSYYRQFDGSNFRVSRWEGHPNEVANAIWAAMLNGHLRRLPILEDFRNQLGQDVAETGI